MSSRAVAGVWDTTFHAPVLADEETRLFEGAKTILDCTLGGGGHSAALLSLGARVTAFDRDPAAVEVARNRLAEYEAAGRFRVILGNFAEADRLLQDPQQKFDAILADLGVSGKWLRGARRRGGDGRVLPHAGRTRRSPEARQRQDLATGHLPTVACLSGTPRGLRRGWQPCPGSAI